MCSEAGGSRGASRWCYTIWDSPNSSSSSPAMVSPQHNGFKMWQTRFPTFILFSDLQWYISFGKWRGFSIFHIFSPSKVWVDLSSGETKRLTILSHGNQVCPALPLACFPGCKSCHKDGTGCSTKHEKRKITGVWVTVARSPLFAGAAFYTDTPSRKNSGFIQPSHFHIPVQKNKTSQLLWEQLL